MPRPKRAARKLNLTKLFVEKVKPEKHRVLYWDTKQHGLALQVEPTGAKAWKAIYSRQGRPRWLHIGKENAMGLADARMLAAEAMLAVAKGKDPAAEKRAERGAGTFTELADRYLEQHAKKNNKSWKQGRTLVERFALPRWNKLPASTITYDDVDTLIGKIEAPIVANQALAAISAVFSFGVKKKIVASNPCRGVDRNKTKSRERVLSESELPKFWEAFDDSVQGRALKALLLLGQRPGEIAHMRREHIVDGWWQLPGDPVPTLRWPGTKNAESHRVWLPKPVRAIIDSDETTGFVFGSRRPVNRLDAVMRDISKRLGVEPVRPHDLRRTHGTTITSLGFGRDAMNRIQNHREGGIASVYDQHGYADENKRVMEAVAAKIMALVEGSPSNIVQMGARPSSRDSTQPSTRL